MIALLSCIIALLCQVAALDPSTICDGQLGPDLFNATALLAEYMDRAPNMAAFSPDAEVLTELQATILELICHTGFRVTANCGLHTPDQSQEQMSVCRDVRQGGLGRIYLPSASEHGYFEWKTGGISCCAESGWDYMAHLAAQYRARRKTAIIDVAMWNDIFDQMEKIIDDDYATQKVSKEFGDDPTQTSQMVACAGCFAAYEIVRMISGLAKMLTWYAVYETGNRFGVISLGEVGTNYSYQPWRGPHHTAVLHNLLEELEKRPELWISIDGKASLEFRAAEVGVYQGDSSLRWLHWRPNLTMLLVDPYMHVFPSGDKYRELLGTDPDDDLRLLRQGLAPYTKEHRASILLAPSVLAASWVQDKSLALVFIDGDHDSNAVVMDVKAWLPKILPGGIIAGHDYHPFNSWGAEEGPSVADGVNSTKPPGRHLYLAVDGVWWWYVEHGDAEWLKSMSESMQTT